LLGLLGLFERLLGSNLSSRRFAFSIQRLLGLFERLLGFDGSFVLLFSRPSGLIFVVFLNGHSAFLIRKAAEFYSKGWVVLCCTLVPALCARSFFKDAPHFPFERLLGVDGGFSFGL